jgi:para-nitrobenzyl esterase
MSKLTSGAAQTRPRLGAALALLAATAAATLQTSSSAAAPAQGTAQRPLVQTVEGPVLGLASGGVEVFTAIPYAAPPVGSLRFMPPRPRARWTQALDASRQAPACPQTSGAAIGKPSEDEDCLFLNVWAPADHASGKRPVMVWIHGSGIRGYGGSPLFDGSQLAQDNGVVLVTINYRLGLLGSLVSPSLDAADAKSRSGNYFLLDQQEALRWVQRNAARFGGDPGTVTVFGESAGGASILGLLASPSSKGLFQRAIVQSEAGARLVSRASADQRTRQLVLPILGCNEAKDLAACLRAAPVAAFLKVPDILMRVPDDELLPLDTLTAFRRGAFLRVPILIGSNADEGHFQTAFLEKDLGRRLTEGDYRADVEAHLGRLAGAALGLYPAQDFPSPAAAESRLLTDIAFACDADLVRRELSAFTAVYGYEFTERDPVQEEPLPPITELPNAAYHTTEEAYVFNGDHDHARLTGRAAALSATMRAYWTAFARTGDPNGGGRPNWPRFVRQRPALLDLQAAPRLTDSFAKDHNCAKLEAAGLLSAGTP